MIVETRGATVEVSGLQGQFRISRRQYNSLRTIPSCASQRPRHAVVVIVTLAIGIAANTAIFSVVNGVLLRPLPYGQDDRVVTVWESAPKRGVEREPTSPANFFDGLEQTELFRSVGDGRAVGPSPHRRWRTGSYSLVDRFVRLLRCAGRSAAARSYLRAGGISGGQQSGCGCGLPMVAEALWR
jgi:hypothetical protein